MFGAAAAICSSSSAASLGSSSTTMTPAAGAGRGGQAFGVGSPPVVVPSSDDDAAVSLPSARPSHAGFSTGHAVHDASTTASLRANIDAERSTPTLRPGGGSAILVR